MHKPTVQIKDLFAYATLSDASFSPDGRYVAFGVSRADEALNGYRTAIYLYDAKGGECRRLTQSGSDKLAYWAADGALYFTSKRKPLEEGEKEPLTRFFYIDPFGGEAQHAFDVPESVTKSVPLSDGRLLLLCFHDFAQWENKNYQAFEEIPFWQNGKGFSGGKRPALMLLDPATGTLTTLTDARFEVSSFALAPDGTQVLYTGAPLEGAKQRKGGLFLYDLVSSSTRTLIDAQTMCVERAEFFDASTVFFTRNPVKDSHSNAAFYSLNLQTGAYAPMPEHDVGISAIRRGAGCLYLLHDHFGASRVSVLTPDGQLTPMHTPEHMSIQSFDVHLGRMCFTGEAPNALQECYVLTGDKTVAVSHVNDAFAAEHTLLPVERFTFLNRAGLMLEGFIIRPAGFTKDRRYPGLLEIHGGPKVSYGAGFSHEMQAYAAAGYYVFFCNPRGSSGRGSDFADVTGKLGTIDYEDIMDFTDAVLAREPQLDPARLGVLGGSYGGFMTNWIIGHTDRFAAACSQRSISNYITKCLTTDIGHYHNLSQMQTDPWTDFDTFWTHSPLKYAPACKTPTLFIHSDHDFRCWMSEGIAMHQALRRAGVDTRLCLFADENHELSRSGRPKGRLARLREMLSWFDKYLKA